ncbi:MAG: FG-GAP-like repeat-containing protein, partial [Bacteroidota bacterium]
GDQDMFLSNGTNGTSFIFLENTDASGNGTAPSFSSTPTINPFGLLGAGYDSRIAFGDVDGDGDFDALITGKYAPNAYLLTNTGSTLAPSFSPTPTVIPLAGTYYSYYNGATYTPNPSLVDLDGDGDLDVHIQLSSLFYGYGVYSFVHENTGNANTFTPTFTNQSYSYLGYGTAIEENAYAQNSTVAFGDLDGDGDFDAVVGNAKDYYYAFPPFLYLNYSGSQISIRENVGDAQTPNFSTGDFGVIGSTEFSNGGDHTSPVFGDLDGDGDLDALISAGSSGYFEVRYNQGTNTQPVFGFAPDLRFNNGSFYNYQLSPELTDLDGDGDLDIVFALSYYGNAIYTLTNTGTPTAPAFGTVSGSISTPTFPAYAYEPHIDLADIDADGDLDIILGVDDTDDIFFLENESGGTALNFASATTWTTLVTGSDDEMSPVLFDIDIDGDLDILAGNESGYMDFFENIGTSATPTFAAAQTITSGNPTITLASSASFTFTGELDLGFEFSLDAVDLNGDGGLDIFTGTHSVGDRQAHFFRGPGVATYNRTVSVAVTQDAVEE